MYRMQFRRQRQLYITKAQCANPYSHYFVVRILHPAGKIALSRDQHLLIELLFHRTSVFFDINYLFLYFLPARYVNKHNSDK